MQLAQNPTSAIRLPEIDTQLVIIRDTVRSEGAAVVDCDQLRVLCPDEMSVSEQFQRIAEIAEDEGWNFAFLADGSVRFASDLR